MRTITLPDELSLEKLQSVQVFDYSSTQEIAKQQIILHQNVFSFLKEGTKDVVFDNSSLSIDNSQFLIMKSGHCLMTEKLSKVKNYRSILLFFTNEMLLKHIRKTKSKSQNSIKPKSVYSFDYDVFIQRFVKSLVDIAKLEKNIQATLLEVKFEEIMLYLTAINGPEFLHALAKQSNETSQKFMETIETNWLSKLTLKELAFLCNMSVSTFKREFEKHYQETPIKWFQNKRLEYAHHLLNQEQKNASEIYLEVGYESLSSFIQAYKLRFAMTPKQQRKN